MKATYSAAVRRAFGLALITVLLPPTLARAFEYRIQCVTGDGAPSPSPTPPTATEI